MDAPDLPSPTWWIGGGSGAGKTTVARLLAQRHGLRLVSTDDSMADHARRCPPADCPRLAAFAAMSMDERWVRPSPREALEAFPWYRGEGFDLLVEDLRALRAADPDGSGGPSGSGVVVEGFRLLPALVAGLLAPAERRRAVWLLPSPAFRRRAFAARDAGGAPPHFTTRTSDPQRALAGLLERDHLFTERLRAEVTGLGLAAVEVDEALPQARSAEALADEVERVLGLTG